MRFYKKSKVLISRFNRDEIRRESIFLFFFQYLHASLVNNPSDLISMFILIGYSNKFFFIE